MKKLELVLIVLSLVAVRSGNAQLFQQQFSNGFAPLQGTSNTVPVFLTDANYVSATPTNAQFTAICATSGGTPSTQYMVISCDGSVITMDRVGGGNAALTRNFAFPGPPTSLMVKFDFNVTSYRRSGGGSASNYVNFNVGTSFDSSANRPSGGFAKFGIGFYRSTGVDSFWYVNNINSGTTTGPGHFLGMQTIAFAVNNSGGTLTYTAPGGASETVADKTWDLWVGTSKEFDDQPANADTLTLSTFKIVFGSGSNTIAVDNLLIDPLVPTSVEGEPSVPRETKLEQNYPNPFNPNSNIRFRVSQLIQVRLAVFDLLGREVSVLVNERKSPGIYEIPFDGSGLASGVYLYRLVAGSSVETRKMVLMR
jgi:hypothetical protein